MSIVEPSLSLEEAKEIAAAKPYPEVTEQSIRDHIVTTDYLYHNLLTICIITMHNGFMVVGVSKAADPCNHDHNVGNRYAFDNAFKHLWQLEGYLLRERLYIEANIV